MTPRPPHAMAARMARFYGRAEARAIAAAKAADAKSGRYGPEKGAAARYWATVARLITL